MALGIIGMFALAIGIIMLIVNAIRKSRLRTWGIIAAVGLVFLIVGVSLSGPPTPTPTLTPTPPPTEQPARTPTPTPTPAPEPESYPMVKVDSYPAGSAERAFAEFLTAWKDKDWDRMAEFTQITWRSNEENPAEMLNAVYGFKDLLGAEIIRKEEWGSDAAVKITATIYYRIAQVEKKTITAMVICETAPYEPNPEGKWGVNPISTMREE